MKIYIFRFGHRLERDKRITTHCALVSRAFGATKMFYSGQEDPHFETSVKEVQEDWGGKFSLEYVPEWEEWFEKNKSKYYIVHLTMYGLDFNDFGKQIKKTAPKKPLLIFIGSHKVPTEIYYMSDVNVCVTNQPHSEVAALGLLLNAITDYKKVKFTNAKIKVKPNARGKSIIHK
jgi:tRNA (cytidine56-2'-O)-methyltransferase